jgi:hypothetical protein
MQMSLAHDVHVAPAAVLQVGVQVDEVSLDWQALSDPVPV